MSALMIVPPREIPHPYPGHIQAGEAILWSLQAVFQCAIDEAYLPPDVLPALRDACSE
ncbi:hypothetical protein D3C77_62860 [compost metagenome]